MTVNFAASKQTKGQTKEHVDNKKLKMLLNLHLLQINNDIASKNLFDEFKKYHVFIKGYSNDEIDFGIPKGFI